MTAPEPNEREREIAVRTHGYAGCGVDCGGCNRIALALARYRAEMVAAEREACARMAEDHRTFTRETSLPDILNAGHRIAAAIRARG